jgi:hypothetical protein
MGTSDPPPEVRAWTLREWLARVRTEADPWRTRFFDALPASTRETIESSGRTAWLPMAIHVELADIMEAAYGPVRAHEHYRRSFAASLREGVFGPLVRTGTRIFGTTPATLLRWLHRGWEASFRNAGRAAGEVLGPGRGQVVYSGLPPVCTASDPWLDSAQGSIYGSLDAIGFDGVVRVDKSTRNEGRMIISIEWSKRARG